MNLTNEQFAQLYISRCKGIGPINYHKLIARYGNAVATMNALPEFVQRRKSMALANKKDVAQEVAALEKLGGNFLFYGEANYPEALSHIIDAPIVLSVLGDISILSKTQVAIVGNRNASANGMRFTEQLAQNLTQENYTVTSGLARGIDAAAHKGALTASGQTIAVVAGGVDYIYPQEHEALYRQIIQNGAVISEMPLGMQPTNQHFPRRNRIVSGLCLGTVVVEAARKSGSLITANVALEQGRDVFAVPGHPLDPRSGGPNHLIQHGATLVQTAEDILASLPQQVSPPPVEEKPQADLFKTPVIVEEAPEPQAEADVDATIHNQIQNLLSATPTDVDSLMRRLSFSEHEVLTTLTEMDIMGEIGRTPAGAIYLKN